MHVRCSLVTGANGFLGSRIVRKLVDRGEQVKALVRTGSDLRALSDLPSSQVRIAVGDVRMTDRVFAALRGCDRMYHVAATHSVDETNRAEILAASIEGTEAVLSAARYAGIERIVVTNDVAGFGSHLKGELLTESSKAQSISKNCYAGAKHVADAVVRRHVEAGLPVVSVYPAVLLGPGDWRPTPAGRYLVKYLGYSPSFRVPVAPGGFCYADVDDVAEGHLLAMEKGRLGEGYILGGQNLDHREILTLLSEVTGLAEPGGKLNREKAQLSAQLSGVLSFFRGGQPLISSELVEDYFGERVFVDDSKARGELGYTSRPVRQALVRACRWFLDHGYVSDSAARRARLELLPG